jgi:endonuclease YncB( thermonuclease family)
MIASWLCSVATIFCISGPAVAIDGDTIVVNDSGTRYHVRLWGIDAEESYEPNGPAARKELRMILDKGPVLCKPRAMSHRRVVARCFIEGRDIAALLVERGRVLDCARYSDGFYRQWEPDWARPLLLQKPYC